MSDSKMPTGKNWILLHCKGEKLFIDAELIYAVAAHPDHERYKGANKAVIYIHSHCARHFPVDEPPEVIWDWLCLLGQCNTIYPKLPFITSEELPKCQNCGSGIKPYQDAEGLYWK